MFINSLTFGGIKKLVSSDQVSPTLLQVLNFQPQEKMIQGTKRFSSQISDGFTKMKCYWDDKITANIKKIGLKNFNYSVVMVKKHMGANKCIFVQDFELVHLMKGEVGEPIAYKEYSNGNMNVKSTNKIDSDMIEKWEENKNEDTNTDSPPNGMKIAEFKSQTTFKKVPPIQIIPIPIEQVRAKVSPDLGQYSNIEMIYAGLQGWELYCRVTKKLYKQFVNKTGKLTKLLEFEIMDKDRWTIKCTVFEYEALKMRDILKEGEVYLFSNGMIKVDNYKKPLHDRDSKYSIIFQEHSKILLAEDNDAIPFLQQSVTKIQKIPDCTPGAEVDVIAILKSIGLETPFNLKGKNEMSYKRTVIICDPISHKECQLTIWRNQIVFTEEMIHKTIKFQSLKTHEYMGGHSLNSWGKTRFTLLSNHEFIKYQSQIDILPFSSLSHKKSKQQGKVHISSIKQLNQQCHKLQPNQTIWSTFRCYINAIKQTGKRWYHACPNCKKAVNDDVTLCGQCNITFKKPLVRYILHVALSDAIGSGSLWTVAHDDFANKIMVGRQIGNVDCTAEQASQMGDEEFFELCKQCLYQEFKVTLVSKAEKFAPDAQPQLKHQITTFSKPDDLKETKKNLDAIRKYV